jgi:hypothetical protein
VKNQVTPCKTLGYLLSLIFNGALVSQTKLENIFPLQANKTILGESKMKVKN